MLDNESLARLRGIVAGIVAQNGNPVPRDTLLRLVQDVPVPGGLTIDFDAAQELGYPMVVLRVPAESEPARCLDVLSPREREVAALIAEGLANKQIARRLGISTATVKDHVHRILEKTQLPNRAAVVSALTRRDYGSRG